MNWALLASPQVITPLVGLIGVLVGAGISARTTRRTHRERLAADQALAERKITADIALAERKFSTDVALFEKKLALDRALDAWKRRTEFAEEILSDFYKARDILSSARSPAILEREGDTRKIDPNENEEKTRALNLYYVSIERLEKHDSFFAELQARRYRFISIFGFESGKPYDDLWTIRREIVLAANMLAESYNINHETLIRVDQSAWLKVVSWSGLDDPISLRLDNVIQTIEGVCRPVIQEMARS